MNPPEDAPFRIEDSGDPKLALVTFAKQCDYLRTEKYEKDLFSLVEGYEIIACDFTHTETIASEWLRWLAKMAAQARRTGKNLFLFGVKEQVFKTADVLGVKEEIQTRSSLAEGIGK
jgi:anti-anti-sigma regulatory factor